MPEISAEPVVTYVEGHWRGEWNDGYLVIVQTYDDTRHGVFRAEIEVRYQGVYLNTLTVDLLSAHGREQFSMAMASRNGAAPVTWDGRLGDFYHGLREAQACRQATID